MPIAAMIRFVQLTCQGLDFRSEFFSGWNEARVDSLNFIAGWQDELSFGAADYLRGAAGLNEGVDRCSQSYSGGEWAGFGTSLAFGAAAGWAAAGTKTANIGQQFSHFIPNRTLVAWFGENSWVTKSLGWSPFNGNYVDRLYHGATDSYAYQFLSGWEKEALEPVIGDYAGLNGFYGRIPNLYKGLAAGLIYGTLGFGANDAETQCGCKQ